MDQGATGAAAPTLDALRLLINEVVATAFRAREAAKVPRGSLVQPDPSADDVGAEEDDYVRGRFVQGAELSDLFDYLRGNLGFASPVPDVLEDDFFTQYRQPDPGSLPLHGTVRKVLAHEWKDVDKSVFPRFLGKRYPLEGFATEFPQSVKVDNLMAGLSTQGLVLSDDALPSVAVDKWVEGAVKRSYAASNFAVRATTYSNYVVQSLLKDFQALALLLQGGEDASSLLALMELQVRYLSDISFDNLGAAAAASGASIVLGVISGCVLGRLSPLRSWSCLSCPLWGSGCSGPSWRIWSSSRWRTASWWLLFALHLGGEGLATAVPLVFLLRGVLHSSFSWQGS